MGFHRFFPFPGRALARASAPRKSISRKASLNGPRASGCSWPVFSPAASCMLGKPPSRSDTIDTQEVLSITNLPRLIVPLPARAEPPRLRRDHGTRRKDPINLRESFSFANAEYRVGAPGGAKHRPDLAVMRGDQEGGEATERRGRASSPAECRRAIVGPKLICPPMLRRPNHEPFPLFSRGRFSENKKALGRYRLPLGSVPQVQAPSPHARRRRHPRSGPGLRINLETSVKPPARSGSVVNRSKKSFGSGCGRSACPGCR